MTTEIIPDFRPFVPYFGRQPGVTYMENGQERFGTISRRVIRGICWDQMWLGGGIGDIGAGIEETANVCRS